MFIDSINLILTFLLKPVLLWNTWKLTLVIDVLFFSIFICNKIRTLNEVINNNSLCFLLHNNLFFNSSTYRLGNISLFFHHNSYSFIGTRVTTLGLTKEGAPPYAVEALFRFFLIHQKRYICIERNITRDVCLLTRYCWMHPFYMVYYSEINGKPSHTSPFCQTWEYWSRVITP